MNENETTGQLSGYLRILGFALLAILLFIAGYLFTVQTTGEHGAAQQRAALQAILDSIPSRFSGVKVDFTPTSPQTSLEGSVVSQEDWNQLNQTVNKAFGTGKAKECMAGVEVTSRR